MSNCKRCGKEFIPVQGLLNYCSLSCRNTRTHSEETKQKISKSAFNNYEANPDLVKNLVKVNTGKKHSDETKRKISVSSSKPNPSKSQKLRDANLGKEVSESTKEKLSIIAKNNNFGGHTSKKRFYYTTKSGEQVYLQSSYEITVAQNLDNANIVWTRPEPLMWVDSENKEHRYYPDFYLPDFNVYLDPKNDYLMIKDQEKINSVMIQNSVIVLMLSENNLTWESIKSLVD